MLEYTRHNLYSKIAEKISRNYSINWDEITDEDVDATFDDAVASIVFYEELLHEYNGEFELEEYQEVVGRLMECYITIALVEKRDAIEELLKSI